MSVSAFLKSKKKAELQTLCTELGLESEGLVAELRANLYQHCKSNPQLILPGFNEFPNIDPGVSRATTPDTQNDIISFFEDPAKPESLPIVTVTDTENQITPTESITVPLSPSKRFVSSQKIDIQHLKMSNGNSNNNDPGANSLNDFAESLKTALLTAFQNQQENAGSQWRNRAKDRQLFIREAKERHLYFTGEKGEDIKKQIKRLEELRKLYPLEDEDLRDIFPELCKSVLIKFIETRKKEVKTWTELKKTLIDVFSPYISVTKLKSDIMQRTQLENEKIDNYVSTILTLNSKLPKQMDQDELLTIIIDNLHPEYDKMIKDTTINSLEDLITRCRKEEKILEKASRYAPPPTRLTNVYSDLDYETKPSYENKKSQERFNQCRAVEVNAVGLEKSFSKEKGKERGKLICFNCKEPNHSFYTCRKMPTLHCYNCGKDGVFTADCECSSNRWRSPSPRTNRGNSPSRNFNRWRSPSPGTNQARRRSQSPSKRGSEN